MKAVNNPGGVENGLPRDNAGDSRHKRRTCCDQSSCKKRAEPSMDGQELYCLEHMIEHGLQPRRVTDCQAAPQVGISGRQQMAQPPLQRQASSRRLVRWKCIGKSAIYDVLISRPGWNEADTDDSDWDFFWADIGWVHKNYYDIAWREGQRINHFYNHFELTRKDLLIKHIKRAIKQLEKEGRPIEAALYGFCPTSFVLPGEYNMFVDEFKKTGGVWIMKPIGRAQGKGIFLIDNLTQVADWRRQESYQPVATRRYAPGEQEGPGTYIAQQYISKPYLIGGRKFDMRIYVLVLSFSPLQVYLYRSGFARFTNSRFTMNPEHISNTYIHLTNVAVQRKAPGYSKQRGCKWPLSNLRRFLESKHGHEAATNAFAALQGMILRSLLAVQPSMMQDKHCFELYGYDVLFDSSLKPWLIEVNASPSLYTDSPTDASLKRCMLSAMLDILDVEGVNGGDRLDPAGTGWELIWEGTAPVVSSDPRLAHKPTLGVFNPGDSTQKPRAGWKRHTPRKK